MACWHGPRNTRCSKCGGCTCSHCTGTTPNCLTVNFADFADGDDTAHCTDLNGDHDVVCIGQVTDYELLDGTTLSDACKWAAGICTGCKPWIEIMAEVRVLFDGTDLYVELIGCGDEGAGGTRQGYLFKAESVSADCAGWSAVALSRVGAYGLTDEGTVNCDGTNASATVTAKATTCLPDNDCDCLPDCNECQILCAVDTPCCIALTLSGFDTIGEEPDLCDVSGLNGTWNLSGPFYAVGDYPTTPDYACKWIKCITAVCGYDRLGMWYAGTDNGADWSLDRMVRIWDSSGTRPTMQWTGGSLDSDPWPNCWVVLTANLDSDFSPDGNVPGGVSAYTVALDDECDCPSGCGQLNDTDCINDIDPLPSIQVDLPALANAGCTDCAGFEDTYTLAPVDASTLDIWNGGEPPPHQAMWYYEFEDHTGCGRFHPWGLILFVTKYGTNCYVTLRFIEYSTGIFVPVDYYGVDSQWSGDVPPYPDSWSAKALTYTGGASIYCDGSGTSPTLTTAP